MAQQQLPFSAPVTWIERGIYLALVLACAVALSPNLADADLWGHVQYGLDALEDGIPASTTYSYTAEGYRWVNHENLSELMLASIAVVAGGPGLLAMKCALGLLVIAIILRRALQHQAGMLAVCVVALLVAVNMTYHWSVRPQVFSYTLFAVLMAVVSWCFDTWPNDWLPNRAPGHDATDRPLASETSRLRHLWWAPCILLVWTNTHGGFVAGLCILCCLLFFRSVQAILCWGRYGWPVAGHLWMIIVASGLATMINPYSVGLHQWLLQSLGQPRPEIAEWHPPDLTSLLTIPLILLTTLWGLVLLASRRVLHWSQLIVMLIVLWQCYEHQRHVPFFAILFGLWMAPHVESLLWRLQKESDNMPFGEDLTLRMRGALALGLTVALLLLGVRLYDRLHQLRVERDEFPITAFQFMADQELEGKLVVTYNWAQYAIAAFCSEQSGGSRMRVGFDGRFRTCYPQEVVDMHFDFVLGEGGPKHRWRGPESPPFDPARVLQFEDPDLALFSRRQTHAVEVMQQQDNWVLLYQDELAQLWGRADRYDDLASDRFLPVASRQISDEPQLGSVPWPALPRFATPERTFATANELTDNG